MKRSSVALLVVAAVLVLAAFAHADAAVRLVLVVFEYSLSGACVVGLARVQPSISLEHCFIYILFDENSSFPS
jgi:hypothetical protein